MVLGPRESLFLLFPPYSKGSSPIVALLWIFGSSVGILETNRYLQKVSKRTISGSLYSQLSLGSSCSVLVLLTVDGLLLSVIAFL